MATKPHKVLICGRNFHARAAFRKLNIAPQAWDIIGFVENVGDNSPTIFFEKPIFQLSSLAKLDFDYIVIAGRYTNEMRTSILECGVTSEKIWVMKRSEYQPSASAMRERSEKTYVILKDLLEILRKQRFDHWFVASSLLAVKRDQDLAWFADVDIAVPYEQLEAFGIALQASGIFYSVEIRRHAEDGPLWIGGNIFQIVIKTNSDLPKCEPAIIDIHALHRCHKKAYYNLTDTTFLSVDVVHFLGSRKLRHYDLELDVPINDEIYLKSTYGELWATPAEYFNTNDHIGFVDLQALKKECTCELQ
jgi:hypothetical protein